MDNKGPKPRQRKRGGTKDHAPLPPRPSGRGGGGRKPRRGGRGGESTRYRTNTAAPSPLQLPHVKVTIRNIIGSKHGTIEGVVDSIREFLEGAFRVSSADGGSETMEGSAFVMAWQREKEEFEKTKSLLEAAAAVPNASGSVSGVASGSSLSLGCAYEEKIVPLPIDRSILMPSPETIASNTVEGNVGVSNGKKGSSIHSIIDTAMSQMMTECGKIYLNYVGGRVTFDEESAIGAMLAEKIAAEKKKMEGKQGNEQTNDDEKDVIENGVQEKSTAESKVEDDKSVDELTRGISKLNTDNKPAIQAAAPSTRIRILSVTPVKKSKRRGDIGAHVELVMYPPDPCLIFKDCCREAGKIAAEKHLRQSNDAGEMNKADGAAASNTPGEIETVRSVTSQSTTGVKQPTIPPIPNFPRLSPAERSRAIARSRVLMNRTIEAMKIYAKSKGPSNNIADFHGWEVFESSSQKTWKRQSHYMVGALMSGTSLHDLLVEEESNEKEVRRGNARADRYDSTIESSDDYKLFIEQWKSDGSIPVTIDKGATAKTTEEAPPKLDEEGRPLAAIVQHLQSKREEEAKAKAEAAAAAARARAAASAAREKARKKELEAKTRKAKARMGRSEEKKKKKGTGGKVGSRPSNANSGGAAPLPGAVLLKKVGGSIPADGFNSK
ncbi:hypothetical protein HJC23_013486 [Cyclotella cryptica]|uniref:Uncharacterized protein n=1 Tax=Cyclotella cryptica TaxID=29204 RepID=A0ABD3QCK6_9STRA|eukprot:CCRYP_006909-RA/>CCRYP_006909-RA protein AED:0.21 eAED:0.21 QI:0/-1/0/1/-1/1/1/0/664